jgi:hypothetical protein
MRNVFSNEIDSASLSGGLPTIAAGFGRPAGFLTAAGVAALAVLLLWLLLAGE